MILSRLSINGFRNLLDQSLYIPTSGACVCGPNGAGKSNFLEAIHILCTGRSPLNASKKEVIQHNCQRATLKAIFNDQQQELPPLEVQVIIDRDTNISVEINGVAKKTLSELFGRQPIVFMDLHGTDLISGPPGLRRRFFDILLCQVDVNYFENIILYNRTIKQRNVLLSKNIADMQLDVIDEILVKTGAYLLWKRAEAIKTMRPLVQEKHGEIDIKKKEINISFFPDFQDVNRGLNDWKNVFYTDIKNRRPRDLKYGYSSLGPHRDDLYVSLNKTCAKQYASQGQKRTIAVSLQLAAVEYLKLHTTQSMIFLIDEAMVDLDRDRIDRVYAMIEGRGQVFVTSLLPQASIPHHNLQYMVIENGDIHIR